MNEGENKIFDENLEFDKSIKLNNFNIQDIINNCIVHAVNRVNEYVQLRRMYLEVNLTIMIVFATVISLYYNIIIECFKYFSNIFIIIYYVVAGTNVLYNLRAHATKFEDTKEKGFLKRIRNGFKEPEIDKFWVSNRFYRGNVPISVTNLKSEYITF
ncbi:MAG: hypothetical protein ACFFD7_02060, partial [Candidatus Thorarchaeota archaeon]